MYHGKVVIKSLSTFSYPINTERCGYLIQNFYEAINRKPAEFGSLKMVVVKHDHHKAVLRFSCEYVSDFIAFKDYFYRYYADRFIWRENRLWPVK